MMYRESGAGSNIASRKGPYKIVHSDVKGIKVDIPQNGTVKFAPTHVKECR